MRLKIKGHKKDKKETLQDSFRNFDKYHGLNYQKKNKGVNKYYKWQKVLDKEKLLEALKNEPPYHFVQEKRSAKKENVLPESICVMKAPFRLNTGEEDSNKAEEKLFESQKIMKLPLKLQAMMDIPLSESVVCTRISTIQDSDEPSSKMIEEKPLPLEESSLVEKEKERMININLNETLDQISIEKSSLSEKQVLGERSSNTPSESKLSKSQPIITNPYIDTAKRLENLTESIHKRVKNLNEQLSVTKNSISKIQEARSQSAKSTPISITTEPFKPFMRFDLNSLAPQSSSLFGREDVSKENLGDSRNTFAKPSCQKSGYCSSSKASAKKTPLPLKEYLESQPSAEKLCPCRGRTSERMEQHHGERSSEKKITEQNSWVSESGIQVRLNKAEILRMEYIRKKSQTPTKRNIENQNYCALSNEKRGSEAKLKVEDAE